tara:strand:- start:621 stop:1043 length:423 start_codon:yes stop_codon:yes gene_type:complete
MATNKTLKKKTLLQLKAIATTHFNKFIRNRDKDKPCISCGKYTTLQAGHFYSAGKHSSVRFNEDNVHGQCLSCNYYKSGDLLNYRTNLIEKIGVDRFEKLTFNVELTKQTGYKFDRFFLIEIIEKYKALNKLQILLPLIF